MSDARELRLGRPPPRDAAVEQVEEDVRDQPPILEAGAGVRRTLSTAPLGGPPRPTRPPTARGPAGDGRPPRGLATQLRVLLASPRGLRQAVLAAEVLGPPAAARRGGRRRR